MNDLLRPFLRKFALVFFDDILIYSLTWIEHLQHVEQILFMLFSQGYFSKFTKCEFGVQSVQYLSHIISLQGVQADPENWKPFSTGRCPLLSLHYERSLD